MADQTSKITIKLGSEGDLAALERARNQTELLKTSLEGVKSGLELLGVGLSIGSFVEFAKSATESAVAMTHMAEQAQISVSAFQTLNFVALDAGVKTEELSGFLNKLRGSMALAEEGASKQNKAIHDLGLGTAELLAMPAELQLEAIAKGYLNASDKGTAWAAVLALLGKHSAALQEVLVKIGSEGISKLDSENAIWKVSDSDLAKLKEREEALLRFWQITKNIAASAVARPGDFVQSLATSVIDPTGLLPGGTAQDFLNKGKAKPQEGPKIELAPFEPISPSEGNIQLAPDAEADRIRANMEATLAANPSMIAAHEALTKALKDEGAAYETLEQKAARLREEAAGKEEQAKTLQLTGNPADTAERIKIVNLEEQASKLRAEANKDDLVAKQQATEWASKEAEIAQKLAASDATALSLDQQEGQAKAHLLSIVEELGRLDPKSLTYRADHLRLEEEELKVKTQIAALEVKIGDALVEQLSRTEQLDQKQLAISTRSIDHDWNATDNEKWQEKNALLDQAIARQREIIAGFDTIASDSSKPQSVRDRATAKGDSARTSLDSLQGAQGDLGPNPEDFEANWEKALTDLANKWNVTGAAIAKTFSGAIDNSLHSVSTNLTGIINRTQTWQQGVNNIALTIETEVISAFVKMGVSWIAQQLLMAVTGKAIQASATATLIPIALAQSAIWAAPATLATIASFGAAAVAAPLEIAGAMAATQGLALLSSGGYTGDGPESALAGMVHGGEFVFSAPAVRNIGLDNLEQSHQAALSSSLSVPAPAPAGSQSGSGTERTTNFAFFDDRQAHRRWMHSTEGQDELVGLINRNGHRISVG